MDDKLSRKEKEACELSCETRASKTDTFAADSVAPCLTPLIHRTPTPLPAPQEANYSRRVGDPSPGRLEEAALRLKCARSAALEGFEEAAHARGLTVFTVFPRHTDH